MPKLDDTMLNYFRQSMTRSDFNIYMDFIGEEAIGLGEEEDFDVYYPEYE